MNPELKEMFFALKLIESYGSGIRRAKDALALNKSPELKFLPDNDYDDYTMAVIYINEEFAAMSREKMEKPIKKPIKLDRKVIKGERRAKILDYIVRNNSITNQEAKIILGLAESTTKRLLKEMVDEGVLRSEGERKGGRYLRAGQD